MSYYNIKTHINVPSRTKKNFLLRVMIPFCKQKLKDHTPYYFSRNIEFGPVVNLYIQCSEQEITYIYSELYKRFETFLDTLSESEIKANNVYVERYSDLKRMNGIKSNTTQDNLTMVFYKMDKIERHGEYLGEESKELFTKYYFKSQNIMEESILYFSEVEEQEQLNVILGLFVACSQLLDSTGVGQGYLSFKSHLLGFLSYKHKDMPKYEQFFKNDSEKNKVLYNETVDMVRSQWLLDSIRKEERYAQIIYEWQQIYTGLFGEMLHLVKSQPPQNGLLFSFIKQHRNRQFRKISSFHKQAFGSDNKDFFQSSEFQAYRMVVNFVYQTLPTLGINSRKRVQMSYMLVHCMEGLVEI